MKAKAILFSLALMLSLPAFAGPYAGIGAVYYDHEMRPVDVPVTVGYERQDGWNFALTDFGKATVPDAPGWRRLWELRATARWQYFGAGLAAYHNSGAGGRHFGVAPVVEAFIPFDRSKLALSYRHVLHSGQTKEGAPLFDPYAEVNSSHAWLLSFEFAL